MKLKSVFKVTETKTTRNLKGNGIPNHPIGIFFAAFLWSFLERAAPVLEYEGVPPEIVIVMQGTIVLAIVVAYEVVARINLRQQQRAVGKANVELVKESK